MFEYPRHMDIYEMRYPSSCADGHQPVVHFLGGNSDTHLWVEAGNLGG